MISITIYFQAKDSDAVFFRKRKKIFKLITSYTFLFYSFSDFFEDYIDNSRPVLFKGLAKKSPAFTLWDDEYLKNHPGADKSLVFVEKQKKENRTLGGKEITLKQFIETYQKEEIYMVNGCPKIIR